MCQVLIHCYSNGWVIRMIIDYMLIGKRVRKARTDKNISQELLAEKIDVSVVYLSRIENGKARPSLTIIMKIAFVLNQNPGYFLSETVYEAPVQHEIAHLLESCSPQKLKMITDIIKIICKQS